MERLNCGHVAGITAENRSLCNAHILYGSIKIEPYIFEAHRKANATGMDSICVGDMRSQGADIGGKVNPRQIVGAIQLLMNEGHRTDPMLAVLQEGMHLGILDSVSL